MRWFRGRGDALATPRDEAAPAAEVHASLALGELFGRIHADSRLHVVDLGPAVGANLSFLSERFACSVEVVDLVHSLPPVVAGDPAAAVRETLPATGEPADLVLAWDIFNYLDRPQFRAAGEVLAARCRPGATLFAMLVTGKEMPREPGRYLLQDGRERGVDLVYRHAPGSRPAPRYRPAEVDQMLPGFSVDRSMLLRHGIQEFLMVRDRD